MKSYEIVAWVWDGEVFCLSCRPPRKSSPVFASDIDEGDPMFCGECREPIDDSDWEICREKTACEELDEACRDAENT